MAFDAKSLAKKQITEKDDGVRLSVVLIKVEDGKPVNRTDRDGKDTGYPDLLTPDFWIPTEHVEKAIEMMTQLATWNCQYGKREIVEWDSQTVWTDADGSVEGRLIRLGLMPSRRDRINQSTTTDIEEGNPTVQSVVDSLRKLVK